MSEYYSYAQDFDTSTEPVLSQTPKSALKHSRFIGALILSLIATYFINFGLGLLFLKGNDRIPLWLFQDDIKDPITETVTRYAGAPMWIDLIIAGFLCGLLGTVVGVCGIQGDVKKGKAIPIEDRVLQPYRPFGVVVKNTWLRGLVFTAFALLIVFPFFLILFKISCDNGGFHTYFPSPGASAECYMTVMRYAWLKGGFCAVVALLIAPLLEISGLNKKYLSDEQYEGFLDEMRAKGLIQDDMVPNSGRSSSSEAV